MDLGKTLTLVGRNRYQGALLVAYFVFAALTCIGALYPDDLVFQHALTAVGVALLIVFTRKRVPLGNLSYTLIIAYLVLHAIGARYVYSFVPYNEWSEWLFGFRLNDVLGWRRNHYDRLVHLCAGLLLTYPVRETMVKVIGLRGAWSYVLPVQFLMTMSLLYELGEWAAAMIFAADWAHRYLGQQGDIWDAHWDMMLATAGAIAAMSVTAAMNARRGRRERGKSGR